MGSAAAKIDRASQTDKPNTVTDLRELVSPVKPVYPKGEAWDESVPWMWIRSQVLEDTILLVLDRTRLREAEDEDPEACVYVVPEMEILGRFAGDEKAMRTLHRLKKQTRGWLVDPGGRGK